ncbi:platelet glycoprotein 4 [Spea bombifrons]|uniref:platelet glycoprotein 4 n=1 Tax=Spea bombifrons TaxID=233779 RepID=UPI00234A161E|nr:platelet glycoprotein 4 [Spea bombifrons]
MCCKAQYWLIVGSVIGGLLAILGGILIPLGDKIISDEIDKEAVIEEGTIAYENWVVPGSPVYREFWVYEVLNPNGVLNAEKPILRQRGPYTYLVRHLPKANVTQNHNSTVSFWQPNEAIFQPSKSIGSEHDQYTVLNLAVAAAPALLPQYPALVNAFIRESNSSLFQKRSVRELLWGYIDPFLQKIPDALIKDKTTGVFYPYNNTADGPYTVYNGKDDIKKVAIIDRYRGERTLSYWMNDYCDMINGTDAASFPPFVDKSKPLYFFSSEICRSIYGVFEKEYVLKGIKLYRFELPQTALASPLENKDNYCYCTEMELSRNCTAAGVLDLRKCQNNKPIFLTLPHYLYASDFLLESVDGLKPVVEEHKTYVDVEPITGFTMHFSKRLQVNLFFQKQEKIHVLANLSSDFVFPVLWLNESATISDESADVFINSVTFPMKLLEIIQIVLLCIGFATFLPCSIALIVKSCKKSKGKHG